MFMAMHQTRLVFIAKLPGVTEERYQFYPCRALWFST